MKTIVLATLALAVITATSTASRVADARCGYKCGWSSGSSIRPKPVECGKFSCRSGRITRK